MTERRLYRSRNALLGGVCAGIADRMDADAIVVRILAILVTIVTFGLGIVAYVVLWLRLPYEKEGPEPFDVLPEFAESSAFGEVDCPGASTPCDAIGSAPDEQGLSVLSRLAIAVALMLLFLAVSMNVSPLVPGTEWWQFWPIALVIAGLFLIVAPIKGRFELAWHALGVVLTSASAMILPMTLNITPWEVLIEALATFWPLLAIALVMSVMGFFGKRNVLIASSSVFVAAFCLLALYVYATPDMTGAMSALSGSNGLLSMNGALFGPR